MAGDCWVLVGATAELFVIVARKEGEGEEEAHYSVVTVG